MERYLKLGRHCFLDEPLHSRDQQLPPPVAAHIASWFVFSMNQSLTKRT